MIQWDTLIDIPFAVRIPSRPQITPADFFHPVDRQFFSKRNMASPQRWSFRVIILVIAFVHQVTAFSLQYCSSLNTAGTQAGNYSIYQSNGLCAGFCNGNAFAIVQDHDCWCSDYVPGVTTDTSDCSVPCPGYPDDLCGNLAQGLYGYLQLGPNPSGTVGANGGSAPSSSTPPSSAAPVTVTAVPDPVTVVVTHTPTPSESSMTSSSPSTSPASSSLTAIQSTTPPQTTTPPTTSPTQSTPDTSTWVPTPITSLYTVTGQVRTVTITPTIPPNSQNSQSLNVTSSGKSGGLGTGGAVGLTIGLVALVAIVCSIIYYCWRRRQQVREEELAGATSRRGSSAGLGGPIPSRTMSENSRYVLGTDGRQVVEAWEPADTPGSRRSRLMPVDQRLDPFAPLYQRGDGSKSRESINTIRDDQDYSRRVHQTGPILRATNPDE